MGCTESAEDRMYLTKLSRLEVQVAKEKELEKLAKIEGKQVSDLNYLSISKSKTDDNIVENTQPKSVIKGTYTKTTKTKKDKSKNKKKKRNNSENKTKKKKKVVKTDNTIKKKPRAKSEAKKKKNKKK